MQRIRYDANAIKFMSLFETITNAKLKDCFIDDFKHVIFVVKEGQMGKAIGRRGRNIKGLERILKRKIIVIEFSMDVIQFVRNVIYPIKAKGISQEKSVITIISPDMMSRGLLIGHGANILRNNEKTTKRYFDIKEIRVV